MSVSKYAPRIGALELLILTQLNSPDNLVAASVLMGFLRSFGQWEALSQQRLHYRISKLIEAGLIVGVAGRGERAVGYKITLAGVHERKKAAQFFLSL